MKLEQDVADHVLRALAGKLLEGRALGELTRRLDSQEEFLAWLLVTEDALAPATELCAQVREIAKAQHVVPATRRQAHGYPQALEAGRHGLAADITALLDAHCATNTLEDQLHADRVQFAQASAVGQAPLRDLLGIRHRAAPR